jgi:membrane-associated phospholipid phosphatase
MFFTLVVALLLGAYGLLWPKFTAHVYNNPPPFNLSALFAALPLNDLSWLQDYCSEYLAKWFRLAYFVGFSLPIIFPCLVCFLQGRYLQGWHYILAGHLLQLTIAFPFYALISVDEIWVVKQIPDGLNRVFPDAFTAASITMNNFPSLHTSVAFASLLVAQREPDRLLRTCWTVFCASVIIATFFFPIHWSLDVISGLVLGWVCVLLSRRMIVWLVRHRRKSIR